MTCGVADSVGVVVSSEGLSDVGGETMGEDSGDAAYDSTLSDLVEAGTSASGRAEESGMPDGFSSAVAADSS
jgi:hypothetical protein